MKDVFWNLHRTVSNFCIFIKHITMDKDKRSSTMGVNYQQLSGKKAKKAAKSSAEGSPSNALQMQETEISGVDCPECPECLILADTVKTLVNEVAELRETITGLQKPNAEVEKLKKEMEDLRSHQPDPQLQQPAESEPFEGFWQWQKEIEERIESRTNRQLRQTLILRNIPEVKSDEKTWDQTKKLAAGKIAQVLDGVSEEQVAKMINRCHRGGNPDHYDAAKDKYRPIYMNLFSWEDCQTIVRKARAAKDVRLKVDFKYGPMTTKRRSLAMTKRWELIQSG